MFPAQRIGVTIPRKDVSLRDPYVFVDQQSKMYYVIVNQNFALSCWRSADLNDWTNVGTVFQPDKSFWGTENFWAPDTFLYHGRYYVFATFKNPSRPRGTSVLVSNSILGPYSPLKNQAVTPPDWFSLDATLFIDDANKPWLLYSHEWVQVGDGQVIAQRLTDDLMFLIGEPLLLFRASEAPWTKPDPRPKPAIVTDSPVIYRSRSKPGELLMTWSSFDKQDKYCIGLAKSDNGKIDGKWTHFATPLNSDDGGHAMIFEDFEGIWRISYHAPNQNSKLTIHRIADENGEIRILPD
jgi:hypothetical protein